MELSSLRGQGMIAVDVETCDPELATRGCGAHRDGTFIAGVAVGTEAGFREYFPIGHEVGENLPKEQVLGWLAEQLALPVPKVGAYLLYDLQFLEAAGVKAQGPFYDIQNADPLLCETRFSYSLDELSQAYLGEGKNEAELLAYLKTHFGRRRAREVKSDIWRCPPYVTGPYAKADVDLPLRVFAKQKVELERQGLWDLFLMESELIPLLVEMRQRGVRVDLDAAEQMDGELKGRYEALLGELSRAAGRPVSVWAAKDLARLFDTVGLKYGYTPKTGAPSITAEWLEAQVHPVAEKVLEARKLDKLRGTFLQGCILEGHYRGRVHCNFNQLRSENGGTVSGRFSCVAPWTPVQTRYGIKRIDAVYPGDEVWTHRQRWRKVTAVWRKGREQMLDFFLSNGEVITCTRHHRFLSISGQWVTADECLQAMGQRSKECAGSIEALVQSEHADARSCTGIRNELAQRMGCVEEELIKEGAQGVDFITSLRFEDGQEEPDEWEVPRKAPPLEGLDQRKGRLLVDQNKEWSHPSSPLHLAASRLPDDTSRLDSTSHRRRPKEQYSRQFSDRHAQRSQADPLVTKARTEVVEIEAIEASGTHEVYDITIEEDESYAACGVTSHNSSQPNLQFIPVRTEMGKKIRSIFLPDEGCLFGKLDYSQIEFRLIVHDAVMRRLAGAAEVAGQYCTDPDTDFHQIVAAMAGIDRTFAKTINFGLAYGEGVVKLARQLKLSIDDAEKLLGTYHRRVPFVRKLSWQYSEEAEAAGIVRTLLGRMRRFDRWALRRRGETIVLPRRVPGSRRAFTHAALNARIQGSAADIMKRAMVEVKRSGVYAELGAPHLTVHDELDVSVPDTRVGREAFREMHHIMETCVGSLNVPLKVDWGLGPNWGDNTGAP